MGAVRLDAGIGLVVRNGEVALGLSAGAADRSTAGTTDDPYLALFDKGVPQLAEAAHEITKLPAPST